MQACFPPIWVRQEGGPMIIDTYIPRYMSRYINTYLVWGRYLRR